MSDPQKAYRQSLLAAIHARKTKLWAKDDQPYREMLMRFAGVASSAELDIPGLRKLSTHMGALLREQGHPASGTGSRSRPVRPHCPPEKEKYIKKIIAVLLNTPGVRQSDRDVLEYADRVARQMFYRHDNVEVRVEMLTARQLGKLIQALQIHQDRHKETHV
ncbi:MAG: DUF1018 domain-containing protein [Magnetococcales bacterium]|nr:DUF1018 domain-containing protein [Magnetococcales bacterium]